jgi:hypothetical protein
MLWLNEREAFSALNRFPMSSSPIEQSRFAVLAVKVREMVTKGWHGVEVEEGFLDSPIGMVAEYLLGLSKAERGVTRAPAGRRPVAKRPPSLSPAKVVGGFLLLEYMFGDQRLRHNRAMRSLFG